MKKKKKRKKKKEDQKKNNDRIEKIYILSSSMHMENSVQANYIIERVRI